MADLIPDSKTVKAPEQVVTKDSAYQSMNTPLMSMDVNPKPGFYRRWIRGDSVRLAKARRAGFVFVSPIDVPEFSGSNVDLGDRVSIVSGPSSSENQMGRMFLMEIPDELAKRYKDEAQERNMSPINVIRKGSSDPTVFVKENTI
jgi:hypothetical protein